MAPAEAARSRRRKVGHSAWLGAVHAAACSPRRPTEATRWLRVLEGYAGPSWTAGDVTLIASHLGEGRGNRPRYEEVATFPLGPAVTDPEPETEPYTE